MWSLGRGALGVTEHTPGSGVSKKKKEMKSNLGEVSSNQEGAGWAFDTVGDRNIRTLRECSLRILPFQGEIAGSSKWCPEVIEDKGS